MRSYVVITGAARGIGAETAQRLVAAGARVALLDRDRGAVEATASRLGAGALPLVADVTDEQGLRDAVAEAARAHGAPDVVIANAGVISTDPLTDGTSATDLQRVLDVNVVGVARTVDAMLPYLLETRGYLLIVASMAAAVHLPRMGAYAASKAAVEAYADALRTELAGSGVDVGVAYFSFVQTDMVDRLFADPAASTVKRRAPALFGYGRFLQAGTAAEALTQAVRTRKRRVLRPRLYWPLLGAARLAHPLVEAYLRRSMSPGDHRQISTRD